MQGTEEWHSVPSECSWISQGCVWEIDATTTCCFSIFVLVMVIVSLHTFWYLSMRVQKQDGGRRGKDGKSDVPCCRTPVPMFHSLLGVSVSSMDWFAIGVQAAWVRLLRCSSPLCRSWCSLEQWSAFQLGIPNTLHRAQDPGMLALF